MYQAFKDNWNTILVVGTVISTIVGWSLTFYGWQRTYSSNLKLEREKYKNSLEIERRRAELAFINDQIRLLYGPLFALSNAANQAFWSFRTRYCEGSSTGILQFDNRIDVREGIRQWRLWIQQVIMPINVRIEETMVSNAHLILGQEISSSFLEFLAHVETYKAVIKNWDEVALNTVTGMTLDERMRLHTSVIDFPEDFYEEVRNGFAALKTRQQALLSDLVE